jgi:hypothetical protein
MPPSIMSLSRSHLPTLETESCGGLGVKNKLPVSGRVAGQSLRHAGLVVDSLFGYGQRQASFLC